MMNRVLECHLQLLENVGSQKRNHWHTNMNRDLKKASWGRNSQYHLTSMLISDFDRRRATGWGVLIHGCIPQPIGSDHTGIGDKAA